MTLSVETTDIPGLLVVRLPLHEDARGWFKENWQRAKMTALGLPDFGPGPAQRGVQRPARRHPRRAHRAVGQVHQHRPRPDLRRLGRHARGRLVRQGLHRRGRPDGGGVRAARRRQLLPGARGRHDVLLPGQRPLAGRARLPRAQPGRPHRRDPLADPAGRVRDQRQGPDHADAGRRRADEAEEDPDRRRPRPARPRPDRGLPGRRPRRPARPQRSSLSRPST